MKTAALSGTTSGFMLNLITNDTQKLLDAAMYFHFGKDGMSEEGVVSSEEVVESTGDKFRVLV